MFFRSAGFLDDLHGSTFKGDDDAGMVVPVHGEGRVWIYDRLPYLDVFVFELRKPLRTRLLRAHHDDGSDKHQECYDCMTHNFSYPVFSSCGSLVFRSRISSPAPSRGVQAVAGEAGGIFARHGGAQSAGAGCRILAQIRDGTDGPSPLAGQRDGLNPCGPEAAAVLSPEEHKNVRWHGVSGPKGRVAPCV